MSAPPSRHKHELHPMRRWARIHEKPMSHSVGVILGCLESMSEGHLAFPNDSTSSSRADSTSSRRAGSNSPGGVTIGRRADRQQMEGTCLLYTSDAADDLLC